jgi:hypothetical protein
MEIEHMNKNNVKLFLAFYYKFVHVSGFVQLVLFILKTKIWSFLLQIY